MKKIFSLLFSLTVLFIFLNSCQKNKIEQVQVQEIPEQNTVELNEEEKRYLLEMDNAGINHNASLDYLASKVNLNEATEELKYKIIKDYFISISDSEEEKQILSNPFSQRCNCKTESKSISEWVGKNEERITSLKKKYLIDLNDNLESFLNSSFDIVELIENIKVIERQVVKEIRFNEKNNFLKMTSILRNSLIYWNQANADQNNPYHEFMVELIHTSSGINTSDETASTRNFTKCITSVALIDALAFNNCRTSFYSSGASPSSTINSICESEAAYASQVAVSGDNN